MRRIASNFDPGSWLLLAARRPGGAGRPGARTRELATRGDLLDRVVAIVNDGVVLNSDLDAQIDAVSSRLREQKLELPPQNVLRQQVLERLVLQEIQLQRATHAGVKVTDETLNSALQDVAKRNNLTLSQLPDALSQQGIDYPSYRDGIRKEITLTLLRQRDVLQHISITPREIDQYLEKQAKTPSERNEYNVSHILDRRRPGSEPRRSRRRQPGARRRSMSAPSPARILPSWLSPSRTARRPSRWRRARLAQRRRAADVPHGHRRETEARRGERAAAYPDRLPHHQAERDARRRGESGGGPDPRAPHSHEDQRARR